MEALGVAVFSMVWIQTLTKHQRNNTFKRMGQEQYLFHFFSQLAGCPCVTPFKHEWEYYYFLQETDSERRFEEFIWSTIQKRKLNNVPREVWDMFRLVAHHLACWQEKRHYYFYPVVNSVKELNGCGFRHASTT